MPILNELDGLLNDAWKIRQQLMLVNLDCFTEEFLKAALSRSDVRNSLRAGGLVPVDFPHRAHRVRLAKLIHELGLEFHFSRKGEIIFHKEE